MWNRFYFLFFALFLFYLPSSIFAQEENMRYQKDFVRALIAENGERNFQKAGKLYLQLFQNPLIPQDIRWKAYLRYGKCLLKTGKTKEARQVMEVLVQQGFPKASSLYTLQRGIFSISKKSFSDFSSQDFPFPRILLSLPKKSLRIQSQFWKVYENLLQEISLTQKNIWVWQSLCLLDDEKRDKQNKEKKEVKKEKSFQRELWKEIERLRKETSKLIKEVSRLLRSGEYQKIGKVLEDLRKKNQKLSQMLQRELKLRLENKRIEKVFKEILKEFQNKKLPQHILKELEKRRKQIQKELNKMPFPRNLELQRKELEAFLKRLRKNTKSLPPEKILQEWEKTWKANQKIFQREWKNFQKQIRMKRLQKALKKLKEEMEKAPHNFKKQQKLLKENLQKIQKEFQKNFSAKKFRKEWQKEFKELEKLFQEQDFQKVWKEAEKQIQKLERKIQKLLKNF